MGLGPSLPPAPCSNVPTTKNFASGAIENRHFIFPKAPNPERDPNPSQPCKHLVHMCQHIFTNIFKGVSIPLDPKCISMSQSIQWHFDNRISIRVTLLLIVRLSILNVITLTKCLDHENKMAPTFYTFALSLLFFSFFFSKFKHLIITMLSPLS